MNETYALPRTTPVDQLSVGRRATFINRTYTHLFCAMLGFVAIEVALFQSGVAERIAHTMFSFNWLLILGAFMIVSWFASRVAYRATSFGAQYGALALFVAAEALLFIPLLYRAQAAAPGTIQSAGMVTLTGFAGLTFVAFTTRKDFSFLGAILRWAMIVALVAIVAAVLFGFQLGTWFSVAMIAVAGGAILYDTSKVLHHFPEDRYVAAALELFASVALLLWYVLRLFMSRD